MLTITIVILVNSRQGKTRQDKTRREEIYIDPLRIMTMTTTMTMTATMSMNGDGIKIIL